MSNEILLCKECIEGRKTSVCDSCHAGSRFVNKNVLTSTKSKTSRSETLAKDHWGYIKSLMETHRVDENTINTMGFHYVTAFVHGYKHAQEDMQSR